MWVTRYPLGLSGRPSSPWPPSSSTRFLHSRHCALPHSPSSVQFGRPFSPLSRLPRSSPLRLSAAGRRHKPRYSAFFRSRTRNCAACSGLHATPRRFRLSKSPPAAFHLHRAPIVVDHSRLIVRRFSRVASEPFLPLARRRFLRTLSAALPSPSTSGLTTTRGLTMGLTRDVTHLKLCGVLRSARCPRCIQATPVPPGRRPPAPGSHAHR
jgi:hypothetical protein